MLGATGAGHSREDPDSLSGECRARQADCKSRPSPCFDGGVPDASPPRQRGPLRLVEWVCRTRRRRARRGRCGSSSGCAGRAADAPNGAIATRLKASLLTLRRPPAGLCPRAAQAARTRARPPAPSRPLESAHSSSHAAGGAFLTVYAAVNHAPALPCGSVGTTFTAPNVIDIAPPPPEAAPGQGSRCVQHADACTASRPTRAGPLRADA
jgi:hypothetical protein